MAGAAAEETMKTGVVPKENAVTEEEEDRVTVAVEVTAVVAATVAQINGGTVHRKEAVLVEEIVLPETAVEEVDLLQEDLQVTLHTGDLQQ